VGGGKTQQGVRLDGTDGVVVVDTEDVVVGVAEVAGVEPLPRLDQRFVGAGPVEQAVAEQPRGSAAPTR
jgi:hypothetical protein